LTAERSRYGVAGIGSGVMVNGGASLGYRLGAGALNESSTREEIVRRLYRSIPAAQRARDFPRCEHDQADGFFG
jgi:hypothetical protein